MDKDCYNMDGVRAVMTKPFWEHEWVVFREHVDNCVGCRDLYLGLVNQVEHSSLEACEA
jgi:predicted anti-sigma-YlaC factor YlaD